VRHDDRPAPRRTSSLPGCAMLGHDCAATRTAGRPTWRAALAHSRAPRRTPRLSTLNRAAPATTTSIILSRSCPMRGTRGLSCGGPADCRDTWKQAAPASKPRKLVTSIDVLGLQSSRPQSTGRAGRRPPFARGRARTRSCPPPPPLRARHATGRQPRGAGGVKLLGRAQQPFAQRAPVPWQSMDGHQRPRARTQACLRLQLERLARPRRAAA